MANITGATRRGLLKWIEKIPIARLKIFHQVLLIVIIVILFFIIQGVTSIYVNDTMQTSSLDITKISTNRFNNVIIIKTYIELIEKEYIKALTGRGQIRFLINDAEIQGLPRIQGEMIPAAVALRDVAPGESAQILTNIVHIQKLIRLPVSEAVYAALKKALNSISISIDAANNKAINASYETITRSSNFATTSKIITIVISLIAITILGLIYVFLERKLHEEELQNLKISQQLNEARFLALQSQINPHFLFNTLNAIMRKSMFEKAPETTQLIQSLSDIFRYNLQSYNKEVPVAEELAVVREYVHIQQARFGARIGFDIVYRAASQDAVNAVPVPRFIIQPLVENAIIHGIEPKESGGAVRIKFYLKPAHLVIRIIDNGMGIPPRQIERLLSGGGEPEAPVHTTGIGIHNVRDRLILYSKDPGCFSLRSNLRFGTVITLKITNLNEG